MKFTKTKYVAFLDADDYWKKEKLKYQLNLMEKKNYEITHTNYFTVDERGKVINPEIIDTFDIELNDAIIDRVMAIKFNPAKQNGRPVRVQYNLPILFQ